MYVCVCVCVCVCMSVSVCVCVYVCVCVTHYITTSGGSRILETGVLYSVDAMRATRARKF